MIYTCNKGIKVSAIAASVPASIVNIRAKLNDPDEDPKFIKNFIRNTGIAAKRMCGMDQTASDFSYAAAKLIMDAGKYKPEEIGVLINITQTPDYRTPSTALALHKRLALRKSCLAFDINLGCSGFVYGVSIASSLLTTSDANKALVLVGDTLARRRLGDKAKTHTSLLFGDASAAILIEKDSNYSLSSALMSDGEGFKALAVPYNAWKHPIGPETIPGDDIGVFNFTISEVPDLIKKFTNKNGTKMEDYDDLVLHQANMMIVKTVAKRVGMPMEKVPISLDRFGNTSGASVPLTLVDKYGNSEESRELRILASGFGVGLSWGVIDFKIDGKDIFPLSIGMERYDDGYPDNVMETD